MKDRIVKFLASERISPAEFADKIGVQRSSMSHILNGRNHPSAAFLQKMLLVYPFLNPRWLMIGEGTMNMNAGRSPIPPINAPVASNQEIPSSIQSAKLIEPESLEVHPIASLPTTGDFSLPSINSILTETEKNVIVASGNLPKQPTEEQSGVTNKSNNELNQGLPILNPEADAKEIEQILFFYKDKTFVVYRPS